MKCPRCGHTAYWRRGVHFDHECMCTNLDCGHVFEPVVVVDHGAPDDLLSLQADAKRWRQLMACERIRMVGCARLGEPSGHICMEFWGTHPEKIQGMGNFIKFLDGVSDGKS